METAELENKVYTLEKELAVQEATLAGAQSTQAAAHSGTWSVMVAGAVAWVVGVFMGIAVSKV